MKEVTGRILSWDGVSQQGMIEGSDGAHYPFSSKEWTEEGLPEVNEGVLVVCQNGRDASQVEYLGIEHIPFMKIETHSEQGEVQTFSHTRLIGGPWRVRSDALVWMAVARGLHHQNSQVAIKGIGDLLRGEHRPISLRGSVIKYCYGIAIELYLKWILIEAKVPYRRNHKLPQLVRKLPAPVLERLRSIYSDYRERYASIFKIMEAHAHGAEELNLDWSTLDKFIGNLDKLKFVSGRYADPAEYSIFQSRSSQMSREMNSYMDSDDFFVLGDKLLAHKPNPSDYE